MPLRNRAACQAWRDEPQADHVAQNLAYITVSLLTGTRTEELRALTWADLDLEGMPDADPPGPPTM